MSDGYQWCPRCCGHINAQALYCRVCKSNIEEEKAGALSGAITPGEQLRQASHWFADYDALVSMMPDSPYKEQMHKALDQRNRHFGVVLPGEESDEALTMEPRASVFALLLELFVEARKAGLAIDSIIDTPELRVLGLTAETVKVEYERVLAELSDARSCKFCAQTIAKSANGCRYCGSDLKSPPQKPKRSLADGLRKAMLGTVDQAYRRRAITFLAARQARNDPQWRTTYAEVLADNEISEEEIETAMREGEYHALEGMAGLDLPLKDWLIRLMREGLLQDPHYNAALDLIHLGRDYLSENKFAESGLILNAMYDFLTNEGKALGGACEPLLTICMHALVAYHRETKNYAEAEKMQGSLLASFGKSNSTIMGVVQEAIKKTVGPTMLMTQADLCFKQGKFAEAVSVYREVIAACADKDSPVIAFPSPEPQPPRRFVLERAVALLKLADCYLIMQDFGAVEKTLDQAAQECRLASGPYEVLKWRLEESRARLALRQNKFADAVRRYNDIIAWHDSIKEPADAKKQAQSIAGLLDECAQCLDGLKKTKEAQAHRRRAQELRQRAETP